MKHRGRASQAGFRLILWTLAILVFAIVGGVIAMLLSSLVASIALSLLGLWVVFACFTLFFFRDPEPRVPTDGDAIVAPAHGKVDLIDETVENDFMQGPCRRISIFLSVFDVHVQNVPTAGTVALLKRKPGQFLNAMKAESALHNENVLIGIESSERPGERIGVRLIAGLIARRIIPYVDLRDAIERGERLSLIQFGSRCDLYLPLSTSVTIKLGDRVKGGQTIVARRS